jgi:SOS-response transcriptional repressor LexA
MDTGIDTGTFSKSIRTKERWKSQHLAKMSDYFKVSLDWLMKGETMAQSVQREIAEVSKKLTQVPILGIVECGKPVSTWYEEGNKFVEMTDINHLHTPFLLVAKGESMSPFINAGDRILCADIPERVKSGVAVVVSFDSPPDTYEANAKLIKFDKDGLITLYSINTKFPPTIHRENEIKKIFKVVRITRDVK